MRPAPRGRITRAWITLAGRELADDKSGAALAERVVAAGHVVAARAIPIVAEVDKSLTMDPSDFERRITPRTKAVIRCGSTSTLSVINRN